MKNKIEKYTYRVLWSEEDQCHIACCIEMPELLAHGDSQEEAIEEIKKALKIAIKAMEKSGETAPEPFSLRHYRGQIPLRTSSEVHRELAIRAAEQGISLNQYILSKVI